MKRIKKGGDMFAVENCLKLQILIDHLDDHQWNDDEKKRVHEKRQII